MKRISALFLSLLLVIGMTGAVAETTLTVGIYPPDTETRSLEVWENVYVPAFTEAYPDVEMVPAPYEYNMDTFIALVESGNLPNLFSCYFTEPDKIIRAGTPADITDQMKEKGWDAMMNPNVLDLVTGDDGKIYGTPVDAYGLGLMINAELFEEAGLVDEDGIPQYPTTWDEVIEVSKTIKEETGSAGLCLLAKDNAGGWHFTNIAWTFGAEFETFEDGKWVAHLNTPEVVAAMQLVKDMKWEHDILTSDPTAEDWGTGFQQLGTGAAAMYIAANTAVDQPTVNYGLPTDKLMLVGMPAGTDQTYSLMGGSLYMFSKDSTPEQVLAGMDLIEIIGNAPYLTETVIEGKTAAAKNNVEMGVPNIKAFPVWNDEEYNRVSNEIVEEYKNVDERMFAPFFEAIDVEGAIRPEEPMMAQNLYEELTKVMQEVITNQDADIQALLDTAQANFQAMLDEDVNS